jgi:hypothetical protein
MAGAPIAESIPRTGGAAGAGELELVGAGAGVAYDMAIIPDEEVDSPNMPSPLMETPWTPSPVVELPYNPLPVPE